MSRTAPRHPGTECPADAELEVELSRLGLQGDLVALIVLVGELDLMSMVLWMEVVFLVLMLSHVHVLVVVGLGEV